jgi:sirohydrochlorin cobaltochelatase
VLLGMEKEPGKALSEMDVFRQNPIGMHGRHLYYSSAIGTELHLADVILDQVNDFDRRHPGAGQGTAAAAVSAQEQALARWLEQGRHTIGQVVITTADGGWELRHRDDRGSDSATLITHTQPEDARVIARNDAAGTFRPIKTAPDLKHGWRLVLPDLAGVRLALEFFYPAALGMALAQERGSLEPVPLRALLGRQTGMYRFANGITDDQACAILGRCCDTATKCLRRIVYPLAEAQSLHGPAEAKLGTAAGHAGDEAAAIPLLCMEACNHIVSAARKQARENFEAKERADSPA